MNRIVKVQRNNLWILYSLLAIVILAVIVLPTKTVEYEELITVEEEIERETLVPVEMEVFDNVETTQQRLVEKTGPLPYNLVEGDDEIDVDNNGDTYLSQEFILSYDEPIDTCVAYEYDFMEVDERVRSRTGEVCFNMSRRENFTVRERYTGRTSDHHFEFTIFSPQGKYFALEDVVVNSTEPRITTTYENVTVTETIEVTVPVSRTKKVNWLFGISFY